ncbi:ice-binding family protein [Parasediminibacterium sp. JCM 36343]|uniref:ice-binding family protein n=1 Tax=Parasediminibacterium sp. JCM 36343 TaxID=3374279 RepID=UPI00397852AE
MKKAISCFALSIAFVSFSINSFAQAPVLGTAANFILFSSDGAVTNTGQTILTGNVGTNNGPVTAFGNVNGVMHDNDGATAQASADLLIAYNQLNFATPTLFPSSLLGNGDTLIAGIYKIFSTATLNGKLYLDAKGNPNAVFIFQIQGAFSTAANAKIILINGTQACNVFWKVEGLVKMASQTYMRGTVVANNAAIVMNATDSLEGRLLSTTGAVSVNNLNGYTPTGCNAPVLTGPAAPVLGASACYALFSGNGAVTNTGVTHVTGDVGTNVGLAAGFNPLFVTGTVHSKPDVSTAACAADLQNVYNYLNTLTADIELLYPQQFGNDLVLTPHTYLLNSATAFTGKVFLNAQGNANAIFVIKINGALSTSTFSKVVLVNGAQAKNVFWKIEGAVKIDNFSVFNGTLVCNNAAIALSIGDTLNGRAFTTNGALSTENMVATMPTACPILPVSFLYFTGATAQKDVMLQWGLASETNNSFFTIEKSKDGSVFETLATVAATTNLNYSFIDNQPYTVGYYRLSQTDKDGQKSYFRTITVGAAKSFRAKPYVVSSNIYVSTIGAVAGNGTIQLYSMDGRIISTQKVLLTQEANTFKVSTPVHKGIYILSIESNGKRLYSGKVAVL